MSVRVKLIGSEWGYDRGDVVSVVPLPAPDAIIEAQQGAEA